MPKLISTLKSTKNPIRKDDKTQKKSHIKRMDGPYWRGSFNKAGNRSSTATEQYKRGGGDGGGVLWCCESRVSLGTR